MPTTILPQQGYIVMSEYNPIIPSLRIFWGDYIKPLNFIWSYVSYSGCVIKKLLLELYGSKTVLQEFSFWPPWCLSQRDRRMSSRNCTKPNWNVLDLVGKIKRAFQKLENILRCLVFIGITSNKFEISNFPLIIIKDQ